MSLPSRGAWIEIIPLAAAAPVLITSLPSRGAWIEILCCSWVLDCRHRRSPHGERG